MTARRLVGGPWDGRIVESDFSVLQVPLIQPVEIVRKVIPIHERLTDHVATYYRIGDVFRWEGLVEDAWSDMDVSDEVMAEGGSAVRRLVRDQMRGALSELADGKDLGRIVWRCEPFHSTFRHRWRALVGPRAVERGLLMRSEVRSKVLGS